MLLTETDRKAILASLRKLIPEKHINVRNPQQDYGAWVALLDSRAPELLAASSDEDFETGVQQLLRELGSSHTAFFREGGGVPAVHAINATLRPYANGAGPHWMFVDVIEDGPAHVAGLRPGELLKAVDAAVLSPPVHPKFRLGAAHELEVVGFDGQSRKVPVEVPDRAAKDRPPMVEPKSLSHRMLSPGIGYLKIATFPGAIGSEFAHALDTAIDDLKQRDCNWLIIDLRGNVGGGLGSLRLMSYLCPDKRPVGHSVTRKRLRKGYKKEKLTRIDRIPSSKGALLMMALRFKVFQRDRSMVLATEGLGPQPFHGSIVILTNEFTHSAAEMVAAFAKENRLATLVGTRTSGEVLGGANFKLVSGYKLRMPVAGWYSWSGHCVEGEGVAPDIQVDLDRPSLARGEDTQLTIAEASTRLCPPS